MAKLTDEEFEDAIANALDSIPESLADDMENVVVMMQDEPEDWQLDQAAEDGNSQRSNELLGLYDGVSLCERGNSYGAVDDWPDTITIFKGPHERLSSDKAVVLEEVRKTVIHEVAHYFGMTEHQVANMGYA